MSETPLNPRGWFVIHNYVFDVAMPRLSPSGWKILCVAIRQTWGWRDPNSEDPKDRKEWDKISFSQFLERTGLKSYSTVSRGLQECIEKGYLLRRPVGTRTGTEATMYTYSLNLDYAATKNEEDGPATESVASPAIGSVASPATNSVETNSKKVKKGKTTADPIAVEQSLTLLKTWPNLELKRAEGIAAQRDPDWVSGWMENLKDLYEKDPAYAVRTLVRRHKDNIPPPAPPTPKGDGDNLKDDILKGVCAKCWQSPCACGDNDDDPLL